MQGRKRYRAKKTKHHQQQTLSKHIYIYMWHIKTRYNDRNIYHIHVHV